MIGWGSHFFCKMPGDGKTVAWHQDASYWPLTPSKAVTVWLAIDDADRGNACMRFIPGTHVLGHLTYPLSEQDEANVLNQTVPDIEKYGDPVYVELKAGEASVHTDLLLHGSEANTSTRRRCGLTLRYTPADVRAYLGWNEKGVVAAGEPVPHWANRPRPTDDEPIYPVFGWFAINARAFSAATDATRRLTRGSSRQTLLLFTSNRTRYASASSAIRRTGPCRGPWSCKSRRFHLPSFASITLLQITRDSSRSAFAGWAGR